MAVLAGLVLGTGARPAGAVDGVIEINQERAQAGGVTAGDAAGFPVTLSKAGSYRLTGDLVVAQGSITAVEITASHVTLDLNGFSIRCRAPCLADAGKGINAFTADDVEVSNGMVRQMGGFGIHLRHGGRVKMVRVVENLDTGIVAGERALVQACDVSGNGTATTLGSGVIVGTHSVVTGSTVTDNANLGIGSDFDVTVTGNNASANAGGGITVGDGSAVHDNTAVKNGTGGILTGQGSTLRGNSAADNGEYGIAAGTGSTIQGNAAQRNKRGIAAQEGGVLLGNTARDNSSFGFELSPNERAPTGYAQNVLTGNNGVAEVQITGFGAELGLNFCGTNTTCP